MKTESFFALLTLKNKYLYDVSERNLHNQRKRKRKTDKEREVVKQTDNVLICSYIRENVSTCALSTHTFSLEHFL